MRPELLNERLLSVSNDTLATVDLADKSKGILHTLWAKSMSLSLQRNLHQSHPHSLLNSLHCLHYSKGVWPAHRQPKMTAHAAMCLTYMIALLIAAV